MILERTRRPSNLAGHVVLLTVCAVTLVPFYWMFATSLKPANEIFNLSPLPTNPTFSNYTYVWRAIPTGVVPFQVTMIPNYVLLSRLGWLDSLAALVIPPGMSISGRCW